MKVIKLTDEDSADDLDYKERVAIGTLKLAGDRNYVKDIGVRDGDFYLLEETQDDADYISWVRDSFERATDSDGYATEVDLRDLEKLEDNFNLVFFKHAWGKKYLFRACLDLAKYDVTCFGELNSLLSEFHAQFLPKLTIRQRVST
tara:strand:- start:579 stop:1016 length:438 start_codon:yes stop_codon:yes gene_type:complete